MDSKAFDAFAKRLGTTASRRRVVTRLAQAGGVAALAAAIGRPLTVGATSADCPYGRYTCADGYVWREAYEGDKQCVDPSQRAQAAADNAAAPYRIDPNGAYGPQSCISGYVWREAYDGDTVCVEPWVRDQVAYDNQHYWSRIPVECHPTL